MTSSTLVPHHNAHTLVMGIGVENSSKVGVAIESSPGNAIQVGNEGFVLRVCHLQLRLIHDSVASTSNSAPIINNTTIKIHFHLHIRPADFAGKLLVRPNVVVMRETFRNLLH